MNEEKELELARASDLVLNVRMQMQFDACQFYIFRVEPLSCSACLQGAPSICPHQSAVGALGRRSDVGSKKPLMEEALGPVAPEMTTPLASLLSLAAVICTGQLDDKHATRGGV